MLKKLFYLSLVSCITHTVAAQKISLFKQFYGNYDFTMIGNTHNIKQNGNGEPCDILTESSAELDLSDGKAIEAAYLYWSGNGIEKQADLDVTLNGEAVRSQRTNYLYRDAQKKYGDFSAFADVTAIVKKYGNTTYKLSDFDLTQVAPIYCSANVNYGGWAIVIIYKDETIVDNFVGVYDGFEMLESDDNPSTNIVLDGFMVTDITDSKIGFLAWEGDNFDSTGEELNINNIPVSNALNPYDNAFNGTNSFTGSSEFWNMDLDLYDLDKYIKQHDTSLDIEIKTGPDIVTINTVVLSVKSVFPDATINIQNVQNYCYSRNVDVEYTVANYEGNYPLKKDTPIAFYINNEVIWTVKTSREIGIGKELTETVSVTIPPKYSYKSVVTVKVDDEGNHKGTVYESNEENNTATFDINLIKDCPIQRGISPNGDGDNDVFDLEVFQLDDLRIYNRYGNEVFKYGKGYTNQWQGQSHNGNQLPDGTYFYVFKTPYDTFQGYIYLIRETR